MSSREKSPPLSMILSDPEGRIYDHPNLVMAAQSGAERLLGDAEGVIPLPEGSQIFSLPGRYPVGWDPMKKDFVTVKETRIDGRRVECTAVAAFLAPGFLRFLLPATQRKDGDTILPLWAYGAVGWRRDGFWVSGICLDWNPHWHPRFFQDDDKLKILVRNRLRKHPDNRLLQHLSHCALGYHCFAAKNLFFQRWEAPLPTSPSCNAGCLGCLSFQPPSRCKASHSRISFIPMVEEVVEVALPHLTKATDAIVSFGQGCEGEPLLQDRLLEETIASLRDKTSSGTIHVNTNGSLPRVVERLAHAGLDSIRVTLASATPKYYAHYHHPHGYGFGDVVESLQRGKAAGLHLALNLLVFPGLTDREDEIEALIDLVQKTGVDMIQMRNLNIDPDWYLEGLPGTRKTRCMGISKMVGRLKETFPGLAIGYFNRTKGSLST